MFEAAGILKSMLDRGHIKHMLDCFDALWRQKQVHSFLIHFVRNQFVRSFVNLFYDAF